MTMRAAYEAAHAPSLLYGLQSWRAGVAQAGRSPDLPQDRLRYYLLGLVRSGIFQLTIAGERRRLDEGGVFLVAPGSDWSVRPPGQGHCVLLAFTVRATRVHRAPGQPGLKMLKGEPAQPRPEDWWGCAFPAFPAPGLCRLLVDDLCFIGDRWWRDDLGRLRANDILSRVLSRFALWYVGASSRGELLLVQHAGVRAAMARFFATPKTCRTVADLARTAGMAVASFSRCFHRQVGEAPAAWLRQQRLRLARDLLTDSDLPLIAIVTDLGFTSHSALSHLFRQHYGCSPSAWRRFGGNP